MCFSSARKDMIHAMFIHKIPAELSKTEFESKSKVLVDEVQAPLVQKNLIRLQVDQVHNSTVSSWARRHSEWEGGQSYPGIWISTARSHCSQCKIWEITGADWGPDV
jgi:hypothetical protein